VFLHYGESYGGKISSNYIETLRGPKRSLVVPLKSQNPLFGKICSRCHVLKPETDFPLVYKNKTVKWIHRKYCFDCAGNGDGTKFCTTCKKTKPLEDFPSHRTRGRLGKCKDCYRPIATRNKKRNKKLLLEFIMVYKKSHPCIDCGNDDWRVLEFDHVRGIKSFTISNINKNGKSLESLKTEISKCDMRCANCHRIRHFKEKK